MDYRQGIQNRFVPNDFCQKQREKKGQREMIAHSVQEQLLGARESAMQMCHALHMPWEKPHIRTALTPSCLARPVLHSDLPPGNPTCRENEAASVLYYPAEASKSSASEENHSGSQESPRPR